MEENSLHPFNNFNNNNLQQHKESNSSSNDGKLYTTPKSICLKGNFHKSIIELENQLMREKNLEIVNQLFELYKVSNYLKYYCS